MQRYVPMQKLSIVKCLRAEFAHELGIGEMTFDVTLQGHRSFAFHLADFADAIVFMSCLDVTFFQMEEPERLIAYETLIVTLKFFLCRFLVVVGNPKVFENNNSETELCA